MREFTQTLPEGKIREFLEVSLEGKGAFHRFKDTLCRDSEIQAQWFEYKEKLMKKLARDWCTENDIKVVT